MLLFFEAQSIKIKLKEFNIFKDQIYIINHNNKPKQIDNFHEENNNKIKEQNRTIIEQESIIKSMKLQLVEIQKEINVSNKF